MLFSCGRKSFSLILLLFLLHFASASEPDANPSDDLQAVVFDEVAKMDIQEQMHQSENICISLMLLGCMGFMMSNFYLVNWPDADIQRISWEVISSTVSIFSAVLLFQACNKVLEYYVLEGMWIWYQLVVDIVHMSFWFVALQLVLAYLSGAMGAHAEVSSMRNSVSLSDSLSPTRRLLRVQSAEMHFEAVKINTICWATLLGHVTGFAAINAWGTLQQAVPRDLLWCTLIPAVALFAIFCIYQATERLRRKWTELDGEEDEFEKLWGEEVAETEDDVMSLCVSFLLVQTLRFLISGHLPDAEGNDPKGLKQSNLACELLLFSAFLFGGFDIMCISVRKCFSPNTGQPDPEALRGQSRSQSFRTTSFNPLDQEHRWSTWGRDICAMCTAWCLHFSVDWWLSANILADGAVLAVICAVVVTCLALLLIFVLDKLADMDFTDDEVDTSLRALIQSLGILIGFSWERSFDEAVGGLAEDRVLGLAPPVLTLLLAVVLASMVMPAWKWYILPVVVAHKEETHKHHECHEVISANDLNKPLLKDASAGHHASEDRSAKEKAEKEAAELQKRLQAANSSVEEMKAKLVEQELAISKAEKRNSELESAIENAKKGAIQEANATTQLQTALQEKEERLQQCLMKLQAAEDAGKEASQELQRLRSPQGAVVDDSAFALIEMAKAETADLQQKVSHQQEELLQAQKAASESQASSSAFEQLANREASRCAKLEEQLQRCASQLAELQAEKNAEVDRMAAIATDTEVRLRHAQTTAEQEQAASKATTSTLQAALAKANDKANATANQLAAVERENQALHEEVQRLRSLQVPVNTLAPRHSLTPQVPNPNPAQVFQGQRSAPFAAQELGPKPVVVQRQVSGPQPFAPAAFASPYLAQSAAMPSSRPVQQSVNPAYADRVMVSLPQGPPGNVQRFV